MKFYLLIYFGIFANCELDLRKYGAHEEYATYITNLQKLYKELFTTREYDSKMSPVFERMPDNFNSSSVPQFNVHLLLDHAKIFSVDAQSQVISMYMAVNYYWQDLRLAWTPSEYGGIEEIWPNVGYIWIPENMAADARSLEIIYPDQQRAVNIQANGSIFMSLSFYIEASCELDVGSNSKFLTMSGQVGEGAIPEYTGNGEWDVTNMSADQYTVVGGLDQLSLLGFGFALKRVPHFYIYVVALPCLILTLLSIIGMFWTPNFRDEQIAKLSIGLTSLISQTVLLDMVSSSIPRTARFPLLGIYVVFCVILTSLSCVVVVAFTTAREPDDQKRWAAKKQQPRSCTTQFRDHFADYKHIVFHLLFQGLNIIGFIMFLTFWQ